MGHGGNEGASPVDDRIHDKNTAYINALVDILNGESLAAIQSQYCLSQDQSSSLTLFNLAARVEDEIFYSAENFKGSSRHQLIRDAYSLGERSLERSRSCWEHRFIQSEIDCLYLLAFWETRGRTFPLPFFDFSQGVMEQHVDQFIHFLGSLEPKMVCSPVIVVEELPEGSPLNRNYFPPEDVGLWLGQSELTHVEDDFLKDVFMSRSSGLVSFRRQKIEVLPDTLSKAWGCIPGLVPSRN